ncbi:MAG TPA: AraC family transcriptional regulator, partial [Candidatus Dormibacteraeota bacterium]|nr:AraC family transcriptional regulator [Candidatus Dormibacteraeota bacterium]
MPALQDRAFRERFYRTWGRESAVISATTRHAEYPDYTQLLSIKMMSGGSEDYFVDGRRMRVDDDTYLVLNHGRRYASRIEEPKPAHSFSVFFAPGLAAEVQHALRRSSEQLLEDPGGCRAPPPQFDERLREHDACISPVLRHIQRTVDAGQAEEPWVEEQLRFLLARLLRLEQRSRHAELLPRSRPGPRRELCRRVGLGVSFIHTHYNEPIGLTDMARAAHLSPFHFLRTFKALHGVTPAAYLVRKRTRAARRLIGEGKWTLTQVSELVGFGSRSTLFRHLRAARNCCNASLTSRHAGGGADLAPRRCQRTTWRLQP